MKKLLIFLIGLALVLLCLLPTASNSENAESNRVLRIHVRANSNTQADQAVKLEVRDAIVETLTPALAHCKSLEAAMKTVKYQLQTVTQTAENVLLKHGFSYGAKAKLCEEEFPARTYQQLTLPDGVYDALIVELGDAKGDNWWCVVYPPLCFVGGKDTSESGVKYRSLLLEIIADFFRTEKKAGSPPE